MSECEHAQTKIVWTTVNSYLEAFESGRRRLRRQCEACGLLLGGDEPHSLAKPDTPNADLDAAKRGRGAREEEWRSRQREWQREFNERQEQESQHWWAEYNKYLASEDWWTRRGLVMQRASGVCEGCRLRPATQVHHLTYSHVKNEFLWQLVAICDECHERVHPDKGEGA